ncbi:MAG: nitroreductase/quinone reductase family protein [Acidimicrobiales bacterium]
MDWPGALEAVPEVDIETRGADGAVHRTTIWPAVDGGDVYIRSQRGTAGRWYQEATASPDVVLHVGGESVPVQAVPAPDVESIGRASAGYQSKYADSPYLGTMTRDEILATTLRLEPR